MHQAQATREHKKPKKRSSEVVANDEVMYLLAHLCLCPSASRASRAMRRVAIDWWRPFPGQYGQGSPRAV